MKIIPIAKEGEWIVEYPFIREVSNRCLSQSGINLFAADVEAVILALVDLGYATVTVPSPSSQS